tara:strand:+ start:1226 stop:1939 length:714 start_codon:yes stop_codon:yes gene_type:complete
MIARLRKTQRKHGGALAFAFAAIFLTAQPAFAIEGTSPIVVQNGAISLDTVPVAKGGTGSTLATDDSLLVGNGSAFELKALTDCDGATDAVTYDTTANAFGCNTISSGSTVYPEISFNSETQLDQNGDTLYIGVGGKVSSTEANVVVPIGAATLGNLRCRASGTVGGTSLVATLRKGTCGSEADTSTTVTIAGTTVVSDTSNTASITAGQCISLKLVATGDTNAVHVSCSVQKTANS